MYRSKNPHTHSQAARQDSSSHSLSDDAGILKSSLPRAKERMIAGSSAMWPLTACILHSARGRCSPFHLRQQADTLSQSDNIWAQLRAILSDRKRDRKRVRLTTPLWRRRLFKLDYIKGEREGGGAKEARNRIGVAVYMLGKTIVNCCSDSRWGGFQ